MPCVVMARQVQSVGLAGKTRSTHHYCVLAEGYQSIDIDISTALVNYILF